MPGMGMNLWCARTMRERLVVLSFSGTIMLGSVAAKGSAASLYCIISAFGGEIYKCFLITLAKAKKREYGGK